MFVAWSGRGDERDARVHWPDLPRLAQAPGSANMGMAVANDERATLEVQSHLATVSVAPSWGPDAATVAEAYSRHHDQLGRHLDGEFATVILDFDRQTLFGTSSLTSARPLAFCPIPGGMLVSDRVLDLLRHPQVPRTLDEGYLAYVVAGLTVAPAGMTALRAIRRLVSGHAIVVRRGEAKIVRVDRLAPRRSFAFADLDTCREAFWSVLQEAVRRRASTVGRTCLSYSGGIDSTAIGVTMTGALSPFFSAFSLVGAQATEPNRLAGAALTLVDARDAGDLSVLDQGPLRDDPALALMHLLPALLRLWGAMRDSGFDAALDGDGGDELFELNVSPLQALRRGQLGTALAALQRNPQRRALLWRGFVLPHLPPVARAIWYRRWERGSTVLPGHLVRERIDDPRVRAALRVLSAATVHGSLAQGVDDWLSSSLRIGTRLAHEDLARARGVEIASPIVDRDVIELVLAIPPRWMLSRDFDKAFLRRALRGRVSDVVRMRPKDAQLDEVLETEILVAPWTRDLLADTSVRQRLREWVRFPTVERTLDEAARGYRPPLRQLWQLHCLIGFAQWYRRAAREYGVD
jgi:asparagine synthetase B (glutamine-hydrolysing)